MIKYIYCKYKHRYKCKYKYKYKCKYNERTSMSTSTMSVYVCWAKPPLAKKNTQIAL